MTCADCRHCVIRWLDVLQQLPVPVPVVEGTECSHHAAIREALQTERFMADKLDEARDMLKARIDALEAFVAAYDTWQVAPVHAAIIREPLYRAMLKAREALP